MENSSSQTRGIIRNRWALLVGINHYIDPTIPSLSYCVNDVIAIQKRLEQLGYTTVSLHDQSGKEHLQPTLNNIMAELERLCQVADQDDMLLVYFSGHGALANGRPVLITQDTRLPLLPNRMLTLGDMEQQMRNSRVKRQVLLLDACHAGVKMNRAIGDDEFIRNAYEMAEGFALIAASTAEQTAQEEGVIRHGLFTHFLLEGLAGPADTSDKKFITVNDLKVYVLDGLRKWTITHGGAIQLPTARTEGFGDIILADLRKVAPMPQAVQPTPIRPQVVLTTASPSTPVHMASTPSDEPQAVPLIQLPPRPTVSALNRPKKLVGGKVIIKENVASIHEIFSVCEDRLMGFEITTPLCISPDGRFLATTSFQGRSWGEQVCVWDIASHQFVDRPQNIPRDSNQHRITSLSFSPDGQYLAYIQDSRFKLLRCNNWGAGEQILKFKDVTMGRFNPYNGDIGLCRDEAFLGVGDWYGVGEVCTFPDFKPVHKVRCEKHDRFSDLQWFSSDGVALLDSSSVAFYSNGKRVWEYRQSNTDQTKMVKGDDAILFVQAGKELSRLDPIKKQVLCERSIYYGYCIAASKHLVVVREHQPNVIVLNFLDRETLKKVFSLPILVGHDIGNFTHASMTFSPDGSCLAVVFPNEIRIFGV